MNVKPYFIGIAGGSASGKTTFANQLAEQLKERKVKVFHMDQYFKKEEARPIQDSFMNQKSYRDDNSLQSFDLKQFYQELKLAKQGTDEFIIIEGLFTLYDSTIYNFLDLKIFIDCRADERIVRRLKRNMNRGLTFDEISQVYLDLVRFRHD